MKKIGMLIVSGKHTAVVYHDSSRECDPYSVYIKYTTLGAHGLSKHKKLLSRFADLKSAWYAVLETID